MRDRVRMGIAPKVHWCGSAVGVCVVGVIRCGRGVVVVGGVVEEEQVSQVSQVD